MSSRISRLTDAAFTERICVNWARRMGIYIDLDRIEFRTVGDAGFAGRGVFVKQDSGAGEFFAMIPQHATLQAIDLGLSTRRYFGDLATQPAPPIAMPPAVAFLSDVDEAGAGVAGVTSRVDSLEERDMAEAFGRGFQVVARGSDTPTEDLPMVGLLDCTKPEVVPPPSLAENPNAPFLRQHLPALTGEERDWWQLAFVLALERRRGTLSPWNDYLTFALPQECLMDVAACFQHQLPLLAKGRLPSPSTSMKPPERNESPLIAPLKPKDFTEMRRKVSELELIRSGYAWRFASLFNRNLEVVARSRGYTSIKPTFLRPTDLRWAMDMVTSRANNFSFHKSTDMPRPYGVSPEPIPGAVSTLCPVFDLLNHAPEMNVLVCDVKMGPAEASPPEEEGASSASGDEWTQTVSNSNAAMTISSIRDVKAGEELCYVYNAPVKRNEDSGIREVDVAGAIARWSFLPTPPLS